MPADPETQLDRALRAKERPGLLLNNLEEMYRAGEVPEQTYRKLRREYSEGIRAADEEIASLRHELTHQLADTQATIAARHQELERLGNLYKYGDLNAKQYEKGARRLESETSALDARAARLRDLLKAADSSRVEHVITSTGAHTRSFQSHPASTVKKGRPAIRPRAGHMLAGLGIALIIGAIIWGWPYVQGFLPARDGGAIVPQVRLTAGDRVALASQPIPQSGGTLAVSDTGTPLDGLRLDLPGGAYDSYVLFDIGYSPIERLDAGEGVEAISPLIHVDADTEHYAGDIMALTVPVLIPDDHFGMGFIYDEAHQTLRPVPTLEEEEGTLTILSTHFCPLVLLSAPRERFLSESVQGPTTFEALKIDTGFHPGRDTWNLANAGSSVAPGGYCNGLSLTSLYHYMVEGRITGQQLWQEEYANGLPEGMGTPGFWQDDRWAIELCSAANQLGTTGQSGSIMDGMAARVDRLAPGRRLTNLERQFYMTAFALYVTKSPQLIGVHDSTTKSGHSLLCYGVDGTTLHIADPNYPDRTDITMPFANGKLGPYQSAQSVQDILAGNLKTYDRIYYQGDISFFNLGILQGTWTNYEAGSIDAGFPGYEIKVTEVDESGTKLRTYELDRSLANQPQARRLRFDLAAAFPGRLTVYEYGSPPQPVAGNVVHLEKADTYIGFLVEQDIPDKDGSSGFWWAGFDWVHFRSMDKPQESTATGVANLNYCDISIDFEAVLIDKDTGEERHMRDSIETSAYGTFSGNTFTAQWAETYEPDPPMEYCTGYSGHISVTIDPETLTVTSFDFLDMTTFTCNGLFRYAATGSGVKRYTGGIDADETHLFCSGRTSEGMPPPSITWEENEPEPGEGCAGFRTYQLISAEDFDVLIQLMEMEPGAGPPGG